MASLGVLVAWEVNDCCTTLLLEARYLVLQDGSLLQWFLPFTLVLHFLQYCSMQHRSHELSNGV